MVTGHDLNEYPAKKTEKLQSGRRRMKRKKYHKNIKEESIIKGQLTNSKAPEMCI